MSVGFVLTIMVLTTEKVFIVEHYFQSYGVGHQNGPRLRHVREHYKEQFNKTVPSNKTILAIVEKFHRMGSILCQRKGTTGHPRTVTTNENHERLHLVLRSPKCSLQRTSLKLGVSDRSVRRMFKELGGFAPFSLRFFLISVIFLIFQVAQSLTETDERAWIQYCSRVSYTTYADPEIFCNIWFWDESHIHHGYINWQTTHFLGFKRPGVVVHMGNAERISFPIRWPTWKCSRITGEDSHFLCPCNNLCSSACPTIYRTIMNNVQDVSVHILNTHCCDTFRYVLY